MYTEYLNYVKEYLIKNGGYKPSDNKLGFRCKYDHTIRVLGWCKKLAEEVNNIDIPVLFTAAIFHDIGYLGEKNDNHAEYGALAFREYALQKGINLDFINKVEDIIRNHSNKELLHKKDTSIELILLMEADLLDEEGAQRISWYCTTKGTKGAESYKEIYDFIVMGNNKRAINPMVTKKAIQYWDKKQEFVKEFTQYLEMDINMGNEFIEG